MSDWRSYHSNRSLSSVSHSSIGRQRQLVKVIGCWIEPLCSRPWPALEKLFEIVPQRFSWLSFFLRLSSFPQHSFCTFCPGCQIYVYIKVAPLRRANGDISVPSPSSHERFQALSPTLTASIRSSLLFRLNRILSRVCYVLIFSVIIVNLKSPRSGFKDHFQWVSTSHSRI